MWSNLSLSRLFDLVVVGDGTMIVEKCRKWPERKGAERADMSASFEISGVYCRAIRTLSGAVVADLDGIPRSLSCRFLRQYNRVALEVMRGCTRVPVFVKRA